MFNATNNPLPGRYLIIGCHHDAWTHGAADPGTGMAVLMEVSLHWHIFLHFSEI